MKNIFLVAVLSAAALSASPAMASPTGAAPNNMLAVHEIHDSTLQRARAAELLFKSVRGLYAMDDGTTLHLFRGNNIYLALVSGQQPVQVSVTKNGKFASPDGAIELRFLKNSGGLYDGVVLSKLNRDGVRVASTGQSSGG